MQLAAAGWTEQDDGSVLCDIEIERLQHGYRTETQHRTWIETMVPFAAVAFILSPSRRRCRARTFFLTRNEPNSRCC